MRAIPFTQWTRSVDQGHGEWSIQDDLLTISATEGLKASLTSPAIAVQPGERYRLTIEIDDREATPSPRHDVGYAYALMITHRGVAGRFYPVMRAGGQPVAEGQSLPDGWQRYSIALQVPTNARQLQLCCVYGNVSRWRLMDPLTGTLRFRPPVLERLTDGPSPIPAPHQAPDAVGEAAQLAAGAQLAARVLHNDALPGHFYVSDGYSLSTNIVPDLSFGLLGATCLTHRPYLDLFAEQLRSEFLPQQTPEGKLHQRVMCQVLVPMWVYLLYHCTGDQGLIDEFLPMAERSLAYTLSRADADGIPSLVDYDERRMGGGADWVDWDDQRLSGSTMVFLTWYWEALRWMAALERELGRETQAEAYAQRARELGPSINRLYWNHDHYFDCRTVQGEMVDAWWLDSQIWPVAFGLANAEQTEILLRHIDAQGVRDEGFPLRWCETEIEGGEWGSATLWRRAASWFGRLGCGDILARYRAGEEQHGYELLRRVAEVFVRDDEIYEHYDMQGIWQAGMDCGLGNYLEHAGGYLWALTQGPFGISRYPVDGQPALSIAPRFPADWPRANTQVLYRGATITYAYAQQDGRQALTLSSDAPLHVYLSLPDQPATVVDLAPTPRIWRW